MRLEVLHVPDCPNSTVLTERLAALVAERADVVIEDRVIREPAEAVAYGMTGSPTLLIDGRDAFPHPGGTVSLSCRLYRDESGALSGAPSLTQLRAVFDRGEERG